MMMNEEKQSVDVPKQPIVFGGYICFSIFFLSFCCYYFNSDVIKTIILFYLFLLSICEDK